MQAVRQFVEVKSRQIVIEVPESFLDHRVEIIVLTLDEEVPPDTRPRRVPHPDIAGKGETIGDIVSPIVEEGDRECLK